jgi:hypothetical protein
MKVPSYIVIHHTAVSLKKNANQWQATNNYHRTKNWGSARKPIYIGPSSLGFYGGYNYEISGAGSVKQFRADGEYTVAQWQRSMNDGRAISIALDGDFDIEMPTDKQMASLRKLVKEKMDAYGIKPENILYHRQVAVNRFGKPLKSCPGSNIPNGAYDWLFDESEATEGLNTVTLDVYKEEGGPRHFIVKDGVYHHILNEEVFNLVFGGFAKTKVRVGPSPKDYQIGFPLSNK